MAFWFVIMQKFLELERKFFVTPTGLCGISLNQLPLNLLFMVIVSSNFVLAVGLNSALHPGKVISIDDLLYLSIGGVSR